MKVVLDTNIYVADFPLAGPMFEVFTSGYPRAGHSLLIPQLVHDELLNKYGEEYQRFLDSQRRLGVGPEGPIPSKRPVTVEEARRRYTEYLRSKLPQATVLNYPTTPHRELVDRSLHRAKPFRNSDTGGYRDALLWYTILEAARLESAVPIAFVTANPKEFAAPNDSAQLHPHLVSDLALPGHAPIQVILFPGLERFVQDQIIPTLAILEEVRSGLIQGTFDPLHLETFTTDDLPSLVGWMEFEPHEIGFPSEYETSHISMIEKVDRIDDVDARQLPTGDTLITYSAVVDCEFDVFIFKADFYTLADDALPYVWDNDWNDHYLAASESSLVQFRVDLVFSPSTSTVKSARVTDVRPIEDWWERRERERA